MRCLHCGHELDDRAKRCLRCGADLRPAARVRAVAISATYALASCLFVAVLIYVVLRWHDLQMWG